MFSGFHHTFPFFILPEEVAVLFHGGEDLTESWLVSTREKTPRIPEARTTDHKAIEIRIGMRYEV